MFTDISEDGLSIAKAGVTSLSGLLLPLLRPFHSPGYCSLSFSDLPTPGCYPLQQGDVVFTALATASFLFRTFLLLVAILRSKGTLFLQPWLLLPFFFGPSYSWLLSFAARGRCFYSPGYCFLSFSDLPTPGCYPSQQGDVVFTALATASFLFRTSLIPVTTSITQGPFY